MDGRILGKAESDRRLNWDVLDVLEQILKSCWRGFSCGDTVYEDKFFVKKQRLVRQTSNNTSKSVK